jgi:hypothetical protein
MKLLSFYFAPLLVFLTAAATKSGFAVAQETEETETETLYAPTTIANPNNYPSERPAEAYNQQQQQAPGVVHHSFVRQPPSPIPAEERSVEHDVDVDVEVYDMLTEQQEQQQQQHFSQLQTSGADADINSQQYQGDNDDLGILDGNVEDDEPLHLHHVHNIAFEPEEEEDDGRQEHEELDAAAPYTEEYTAPTPTSESSAMKESVHRHRHYAPPAIHVSEAGASRRKDADNFYQQQQQQQQSQQPEQVPEAELDVEQLKILLQQRQHDAHARDDSDASITEDEGEDEDDRTLLDIFGEATKEYLTQNVVRYKRCVDTIIFGRVT